MSGRPPRERILDGALHILAEHGPAGLTVRAVAAAADCSTTGIYTYFGGKAGLLDAIYADGFTRFRAYVAQADGGDDPVDALVAACRRYWSWALANPTQYQLMFVTAQTSFTPSPSSVALAEASYADLVERVRGVRTDVAGADVEDAAHHLWALLHGYVMLQVVAAATSEPEAAARFERGVLAMVRTGAPAPH